MGDIAVTMEDVWKNFRLYHERNRYLKTTLLKGKRSKYEEFWALEGIDLEIHQGDTFGIIGSNGSGKSTLLKCLAGILTPDRGKIEASGRIVALLELGAGFHPELTGRENIGLNGAILGMTSAEVEARLDDIVGFSGLEQFIDTPVKNYSSGMVVRLGFAIATSVDPEILVIDEVLAVGDASFQQRCFERIEHFRKQGRTVILVSHGLSQITQLCDQAAWIEKGKLRALGSALEIVSEYTGVSYGFSDQFQEPSGDRWGTGEARITEVDLLDGSGVPAEVFTSGEPFNIQIACNADTPIQDVVLGVRITDLHGNPVWGTNTRRRGVQIPSLFGPSEIRFMVPALPLLEGAFELTVALSDMTEVRVYDHWERRIRFNVRQKGGFDEGIVSVEGNWTTSQQESEN